MEQTNQNGQKVKDPKKKFGAREIAIAGLLLAICIVSQIFKNLSVFITGPIINACLILCTYAAGIIPGLILSIITPVTAAFITGAPIMAAIPQLPLLIMGGNAVLVIVTGLFGKKKAVRRALGMGVGSVAKAIFMAATISYGILPALLPGALGTINPKLDGAPAQALEKALGKMLPMLQAQFSVTQLITALIGSVIAFIIWIPVSKVLNKGE